MINLHIHPSLRQFTDHQSTVQLEAATLDSLLTALWQAYPTLEAVIRQGEGLNPYVNLYLNGQNTRALPDGTPLSHQDELELISAIVGG